MSNNDIVMIIYNTINIKGICYKLGIKRDVEDIEQIVYDIVLRYDNDKMNNIYNNGALLSFVYICIRNQIQHNKKGEWYMLQEYDHFDFNIEINDDQDTDKENLLEFIESEFKTIYHSQIKKMTYKEQCEYANKLLFKHKILKKDTLTGMSKKFGISRNVVNNIIQSTKKELKTKYENKYNSELSPKTRKP